AHQPGDTIRLDIARGDDHIVRSATLLTRAEVLQRRFVGHAFKSLEVTDADGGASFDLADLGGRTRVVAWFDAEKCSDCDVAVRRVVSALGKGRAEGQPQVVAVAAGRLERNVQDRLATRLGV